VNGLLRLAVQRWVAGIAEGVQQALSFAELVQLGLGQTTVAVYHDYDVQPDLVETAGDAA
jgi:hypothetical protein